MTERAPQPVRDRHQRSAFLILLGLQIDFTHFLFPSHSMSISISLSPPLSLKKKKLPMVEVLFDLLISRSKSCKCKLECKCPILNVGNQRLKITDLGLTVSMFPPPRQRFLRLWFLFCSVQPLSPRRRLPLPVGRLLLFLPPEHGWEGLRGSPVVWPGALSPRSPVPAAASRLRM